MRGVAGNGGPYRDPRRSYPHLQKIEYNPAITGWAMCFMAMLSKVVGGFPGRPVPDRYRRGQGLCRDRQSERKKDSLASWALALLAVSE